MKKKDIINDVIGGDESYWGQFIGCIMNGIAEDIATPLRVAVIGESGVGKSSTINALFGTELPVSHFGSCTQVSETVSTKTSKGVPIEIIDMPGLGAGRAESRRHWKTYRQIIPTVDCVVWIISAGDRALEGMQRSLKTISGFSDSEIMDHIVIGINKAEHMHPENWNSMVNLPSEEQLKNLEKFCNTVKKAVQEIFPGWNGPIRFYSAKKQFRLNDLLEQMILLSSHDSKLKVAQAADPKSFEDCVEDKRALDLAKRGYFHGK